MKYRKGYKYQLVEDESIKLDFSCPDIITEYIEIIKGVLTAKKGYAWDGCSGPSWDDKTNMRGGLFHDAMYQLIRMGLLGMGYRHQADKLLRTVCREDGMNWFRAWYYFEGVDHFAKFAAKGNPYPILTAP